MELAEMENESVGCRDVFVLLSLSSWSSTPLFSSRLSVIFRHYCLSLSVSPIQSLPLSLSLSHTLTYKQRELSLAYRDPLRLWSKAFIWWLGLKNGHLLLPLIDRVSVLCGALFIQSAVCLLLFGKTTQTDSHTRSCILCLCLCVKRTESKMRKMRKHTHRRSRSIDINIINGLFGLLPPVNYTQTGYSI